MTGTHTFWTLSVNYACNMIKVGMRSISRDYQSSGNGTHAGRGVSGEQCVLGLPIRRSRLSISSSGDATPRHSLVAHHMYLC